MRQEVHTYFFFSKEVSTFHILSFKRGKSLERKVQSVFQFPCYHQFFLQLVSQWRCKTSCRYRLHLVKCPLCKLPRNVSGLTTIAQNKVVLSDASFLCNLFRNVEKEVHCKLRVARSNLELRLAIFSKQYLCNLCRK